ncbi:hypothetical protein AB0D66_30865 [Streptomyces sp. NPDC048270]|uniref:hypothetical protein n=1 Tax=Streptomyces sp. NPDC048270 TaxID=3154615 RepID=UPI0033CE310D
MYQSDVETEYAVGNSFPGTYSSSFESESSNEGDEQSEQDSLRLTEGHVLNVREIPMGWLESPTELYDSGQGLCSGEMGDCNTVIVAWDWRDGFTSAGEPYGYFRHMKGAHGAGGMANVDFENLYAGVPVDAAYTYVLKASATVGSPLDHAAFLRGAAKVGLDPRNALIARGISSCYTVLRDGTLHIGQINGVEYSPHLGRGITDSLVQGYDEP